MAGIISLRAVIKLFNLINHLREYILIILIINIRKNANTNPVVVNDEFAVVNPGQK